MGVPTGVFFEEKMGIIYDIEVKQKKPLQTGKASH